LKFGLKELGVSIVGVGSIIALMTGAIDQNTAKLIWLTILAYSFGHINGYINAKRERSL